MEEALPLFLALLTEDEEFDEDTAMMMMLLAMHEEEEQQRHRDAPLDDDEREPRVRLGYEALCAKYSRHAFKLHFRFDKEDIPRLAKALEMPVIKCPVTGARAEPCDALLYVLKRHAYPIRWVDMDAFFGRAVSTLAGIVGETLRFLYNHWVVRIVLHMDVERLDPGKLGEFANAIYAVTETANIAAFIDGTVRRFCRPGGADINQQAMYSGHKRWHGYNYEALYTPDGILIRVIGPFDGRRHDMHMLHEGNLIAILLEWFGDYHVYGDLGYPIIGNLLAGWKGKNLPAHRDRFNKRMSRARVAIEQAFGHWVSTFKFVQHYQNLKPRLQAIPLIHLVTVLLTNCHVCLYPTSHPTCSMFDCEPPELEDYLSDFDPAYYAGLGLPI